MKTKLAILAFAAAVGLSSAASSATYNNVFGVVHEGGAPLQSDRPLAGLIIGDTGNNPANVILNIAGPTQVYGGVARRDNRRWGDSFRLVLDQSYRVTLDYAGQSTRFDGRTSFGDNSQIFNGTGSIVFGNFAAGTYDFFMDPRLPFSTTQRDREVGTYTLDVTPVPLPAGVLLMMTGLGGLAFMHRRRRTA
ncbi:MAG: VPLPA-CTERM sorting domain-containing protein [Roseobacter sp.]|jgi:hypothetical protein|nr:VPLPA-CTERM sorting domain-containing protein [Roseobacter sp.]